MSSVTFEEHLFHLVFALSRSSQLLPDATMSACERAADLAGRDLGDITTHRAAVSNDIITVVLRLYRQGDPQTRSQCLDVIDKLSDIGAHGLEQALSGER